MTVKHFGITQHVLLFGQRQSPKLIALLFWAVIVGGYWWYTKQHGLEPTVLLKQLNDWFVNDRLGPMLFILFFALQPLVFFPTVVMGITAGCLYGPFPGVLYAILGANGAAWITYAVGRFFGRGVLEDGDPESRLYRYTEKIRHNTFETIVTLNLLFVPFDLLNYTAGFLRVKWKSFIPATAIGSLPGTFTFVMFGASLEGDMLSGQMPNINWSVLAISATMLITSVSLSQYLKRRQRNVA